MFTFVNIRNDMDFNEVNKNYKQYKNEDFTGRYLDIPALYNYLLQLPSYFEIVEIGKSVQELPIYAVYWGKGSYPILAWSQMHGNETTTTKALLDLVNWLIAEKDSRIYQKFEAYFKVALIFVLNPDGAVAYTRLNAHQVDLNRDANIASQPEMKALHSIYKDFKPALCLNLHGQRSIFSAGMQAHSAVVSFLSPSVNTLRSITSTRIQSMQLIVAMNDMLQELIPHQVGRYDDAYNPACAGDYFQGLQTPTILFEAGHFPLDYQREETRKLLFLCYLKLLFTIVNNIDKHLDYKDYFQIPSNQKLFYDWIIRGLMVDGKVMDVAIQYEEKLVGQKIEFVPKLQQIGELSNYFGHREMVAMEELTHINGKISKNLPELHQEIQEIRTKTKYFSFNILN